MKKDEKRVTIQLRVEPKLIVQLDKSAKAKGLDRSSLVRMWLIQNLGAEKE